MKDFGIVITPMGKHITLKIYEDVCLGSEFFEKVLHEIDIPPSKTDANLIFQICEEDSEDFLVGEID